MEKQRQPKLKQLTTEQEVWLKAQTNGGRDKLYREANVASTGLSRRQIEKWLNDKKPSNVNYLPIITLNNRTFYTLPNGFELY